MNDAERELQGELLSQLRAFAQTQTEFTARLGGLIFNNVLEVFSGVFPDLGGGPLSPSYITRSWGVAAGAIEVYYRSNTATALCTVAADSPGSGVPTGTGTALIAVNTYRTVSLASRELTLFGLAGDLVSFQVFTKAAAPSTA